MKHPLKKRTAVLTACLLFFTILSVSGPVEASRVLLDRVVAVVNGEVITWSQLRQEIPPERLEVVKSLPDYKSKEAVRLLESRALEMLIETRLQVQEAGDLGYTVRETELDAAIADIKSKYNINDEQLLESLGQQNIDLETYRRNLKNQILISRAVNDAVRTKIVVSGDEISKVLNKRYPELAEKKSEAKLRLIRLECGDDRGDEETRLLAEELSEKIRAGGDFDELAREYSDDPSSVFGGDIGYVKRGTIMRQIEEAAFQLEEGEVSMPIDVSGSFCLVYLEKYKDHSAEVSAAREEIKKELMDEKFQKAILSWIRGLKAKARIEILKASGE